MDTVRSGFRLVEAPGVEKNIKSKIKENLKIEL